MIAMLGGTFDPIHNGHLYIATAALTVFSCDKILFVPNREPVHRDHALATADERAEMVAFAIETNSAFQLCDIELERPAPSYTIDTIKTLSRLYEKEELALILGSDAYAHFTEWLHFEEILEYAKLIVVNRLNEGNTLTSDEQIDQTRVLSLDIEPYPISSTDVRQHIRDHETIDDLVPDAVQAYIVENGLYSYSC